MTLQDLTTILIGTILTACAFVSGQWAWQNRLRIADYYFTDRARYRLRIMSSDEDAESEEDSNEIEENSLATTTQQNNNNGIATPQNDNNDLLLQAKAESLAKMVKAGKIGETDGIKLIFEVSPSSSNPRYIAARSALKSALERLDNPYPNRTTEQQEKRKALGMDTKYRARTKVKA